MKLTFFLPLKIQNHTTVNEQ
uniref:Uncharacterized protein n=1 Tax=Anguilla anguilla TaxID=7936 RepID=A0A0E9W4I3_ANGAN